MITEVRFKVDFFRVQETFTHKDDDGALRVFMTGEMTRFTKEFQKEIFAGIIPGVKSLLMPVQERTARHIQRNMGLEVPRLKRLKEPYLSAPIIGILWPPQNRELTIVDGNHRYVRRFQRNKKDIKVFAFRHPFWQHFLLPQDIVREVAKTRDMLKDDSGIIEFEKKYGTTA